MGTFSAEPNTYVDEAETFDETTSTSFSVEKMAHFLRCGSEAQQTVVLFDIQQLLEHCFEETVETLVPLLCECIPYRSEELQLSASEAFAEIVQQPIPSRTTKMIVDMAFEIIRTTHTADSFEAWGEILVVVLPDVKWRSDIEVQSILRTVDEFSKTENESCRKLAARILGSLSASIKSDEIKKSVLIRAMGMAQDVDVEVRGMVAESFSFIGADLDLRLTEKTLWPKLLALLHDPDARIHAACLRSIAHILEAKREEGKNSPVFRKILSPVFAKECAFARRVASQDQRTVDDDSYLLLEIMAEVFGPFLYALHPYLSDEIKKEAFKAFLVMSTCNGPIVRRYCAFNLPGVALSLQGTFKADMAGITEFLGRDPDVETRWNLAAGIHKTCSILMCKQTMNGLHKVVMSLLQDGNPLVRMNALENFQELVRALQVTSDSEKWSSSSVIPFFKKLTLFSEGNWRTQELLAKQLKLIAEFVPYNCLKDLILPMLYQMAEEGTYCVRREAMMAIAKTIWCIPIPEEREAVVRNFFLEWGQGGVYWMRMAFIDCAEEALKFYSFDLFSYLFLPAIYQLARDNVPNVRLRVAKMIHELAPSNHNDEEFQRTIRWFKEDVDPDVRGMVVDIENKVKQKIRNIKFYRKENEGREEAETRMEEKALFVKGEGRKKVNMKKMKASSILPRLTIKAGRLSPLPERSSLDASSPVSGASEIRSPRKSPSKLTLKLSGGKLKDLSRGSSSGEDGNGTESSAKSPGRKSLKQILTTASPRRSKLDFGLSSPRRTKLNPRNEV